MNESKEQLETLLSDYVEGNLVGDELKSVESYLDSNPGVRDAVNRLMIDSEALRSLPRVNAPFDFSEDVRGQLERDLLLDDGNSGHPRRKRISSTLMAMAAMLMIFVGIGGTAYWILSNRPAPFLDVALHAPSSSEADKESRPDNLPALSTPEESSGKPMTDSMSQPDDMLERPSGPTAAMSAAKTDTFADKSSDNLKSLAGGALSATRAPAEVAELIGEAPRYNARAVVLVIDADHADSANETVQAYFAANSVRSVALSYDATRNRAILPQSVPERDAVADSRQEQQAGSQVSGVLTNASTDPIAQAMRRARGAVFSADESQPQVVLASGLTSSQTIELQASLQSSLGERQAIAYEVADYDSNFQIKDIGVDKAAENKANVDDAGADLKRDAESRLEVGSKALPLEQTPVSPSSQPALLSAGDRLIITLMDPNASNLKSQQRVVIDAVGNIELPMLKSIKASEMTLAALRVSIVDQYISSKLMREPIVNVEMDVKPDAATTQPVEVAAVMAERASGDLTRSEIGQAESLKKQGTQELIDVFLVVCRKSPTSQPTMLPAPAEASPATQPQ